MVPVLVLTLMVLASRQVMVRHNALNVTSRTYTPLLAMILGNVLTTVALHLILYVYNGISIRINN